MPEFAARIGSEARGVCTETGAVAFLAGSRIVPHIPQNRKLLELTSPHFGQTTCASPASVFLECNSEDAMTLKDAVPTLAVVPVRTSEMPIPY
jgi:hypothetical protein